MDVPPTIIKAVDAELERLRRENEQLREELAHARELIRWLQTTAVRREQF